MFDFHPSLKTQFECYYPEILVRKDKLLKTKTIENTRLEMNVLMQINHPFLCSLNYVFQSPLRLYFVMPLIAGGV